MSDGRLKCDGCCVIRKSGAVIFICPNTSCTAQRYYSGLLIEKAVNERSVVDTYFT
jgi:ribosomal protein L36